jgi:hypothetical protein
MVLLVDKEQQVLRAQQGRKVYLEQMVLELQAQQDLQVFKEQLVLKVRQEQVVLELQAQQDLQVVLQVQQGHRVP